ncbi:hypothetical protein POTOM_058219 [Populus tomentosa]|uniref:Uncharacterized protein n=1 Tax=Populus tomentosa TaxID=118781 RepID=A0A8X7XUU6_POPTO|nr:hypothetical protein POTOM_058219 [Populus tomentosa]
MALSGNWCWDMLKDLSSNAVRLKTAGVHPPNPNSGEDRIVQLLHVFRDANHSVDLLASHAYSFPIHLVWVANSPPDCLQIL